MEYSDVNTTQYESLPGTGPPMMTQLAPPAATQPTTGTSPRSNRAPMATQDTQNGLSDSDDTYFDDASFDSLLTRLTDSMGALGALSMGHSLSPPSPAIACSTCLLQLDQKDGVVVFLGFDRNRQHHLVVIVTDRRMGAAKIEICLWTPV